MKSEYKIRAILSLLASLTFLVLYLVYKPEMKSTGLFLLLILAIIFACLSIKHFKLSKKWENENESKIVSQKPSVLIGDMLEKRESYTSVKNKLNELDVVDENLSLAADEIMKTKIATTTTIQRGLRIGYARAARIIDTLELLGIVGPFLGSKPRDILLNPREWFDSGFSKEFSELVSKFYKETSAVAQTENKEEGRSKGKYSTYHSYYMEFVKSILEGIEAKEVPNIDYFRNRNIVIAGHDCAEDFYIIAKELKIIEETKRGAIKVPKFVISKNEFISIVKGGILNDYLFDREIPTLTEDSDDFEREFDNPYDFEEYCAELLRSNGYKADTTPKSGDFGADVLAEREGIKFAIQCKLYANSVGVEAIQQILAGKNYYHCDIAIIISTGGYTKQAVKLAEELNVKLWGNEELAKLAKQSESDTTEEQFRLCPYCGVKITTRVRRCPNCNSILN